MRTRIEIENIALRWSLEKGGLEWEANLISSFHRLSKQTKLSNSKPGSISSAWSKEHADFHTALVAACDSESLLQICSRLFEQAERYVTLSIISNGPRRDDVTEHKQLMRAALSRDIDRTLELNRAHINRTLGKAAAWLAAHSAPVNPAVGRSQGKMSGTPGMGLALAMTARCPRHIAASELGDLVARLFIAAGVPSDAAHAVAAGLVDADLEGLHSHGVMLVDMYIERICQGSVSRSKSASIVSDRQGAVVLDAGNALGQLTGRQAMEMAIGKAKEFGAGIVAVRHGFHFGTAGKYAQQAAAANCIGIAMCNTRPLMPAPGGAERVVGNNPIAVALPTDDEIPLILDMATSEAAMGKIRIAEKAKEPIPATWAVTAQGEPTTNPSRSNRRHAAALGRRERFRLGVDDRFDVRAVIGRRERRGRAPAVWRFCRALRLLPSLHRDRYRPFRRSRRISAARGSGRPADPWRPARAGHVAIVYARRAGMAAAQTGRWRWCTLDPAVADMLTRFATKLGVRQTRFSNRRSPDAQDADHQP